MDRLARMLAGLLRGLAGLLGEHRRDWVHALLAETDDLPALSARLAWLGGGLWLVAREVLMNRIIQALAFAADLKAKGGHEVTVFNRTAAKAEQWVSQHGGKSAPTPRQAAAGQDFVMACVGNDNDLRQVMLGEDGVFAGTRAGAIVVDHTTASAEIARELHAEAKQRGFEFIDAPVSGGQAGAENGVLTVMCGGDPSPFAAAEKVIAAYARTCNLMGASGSGQLAKMANQICIAGIVEGLAEALHFAMRAGLDLENSSPPSPRAPRNPGRWRTATRPWSPENSTSVSRSIGCARISPSVSTRRGATAPSYQSPLWLINSTRKCRPWAAAAGTRRA